jgi:hypothetical protein
MKTKTKVTLFATTAIAATALLMATGAHAQNTFPSTVPEKACWQLMSYVLTRFEDMVQLKRTDCEKLKSMIHENSRDDESAYDTCAITVAIQYRRARHEPELDRLPKDVAKGISENCFKFAVPRAAPKVQQEPAPAPRSEPVPEYKAPTRMPIPGGRNIGIAEQPAAAPPVPVMPEPEPYKNQVEQPVAPQTLPPAALAPLSSRLAEINQLSRQSLPIITQHCGKDALCRQQQTAAMQELMNKEREIAKALRNPTSNMQAVQDNDTVNACKVMWRAAEDFVGLVQCINDATPPAPAPKQQVMTPSLPVLN